MARSLQQKKAKSADAKAKATAGAEVSVSDSAAQPLNPAQLASLTKAEKSLNEKHKALDMYRMILEQSADVGEHVTPASLKSLKLQVGKLEMHVAEAVQRNCGHFVVWRKGRRPVGCF